MQNLKKRLGEHDGNVSFTYRNCNGDLRTNTDRNRELVMKSIVKDTPLVVDTRIEICEFEWCVNWCKAKKLNPYEKENWDMAKAEWEKK